MKKLSIAAFAVIVIAAIYYMTSGSTQLVSQMRSQVDSELASLQTQGFTVKGREVNENKEHFVITFDEPEKIAAYLTKKGSKINQEDAEILKGLEVGVDINYLSDAYSGVSFDLYPLVLPESLTSAATTPEDKHMIQQVEKMLEKKTFLVHTDINKLGTGFKGYMKDIDETITDDNISMQIKLSELRFTGDIKADAISTMKQTLKSLSLNVPDTMDLSLNGLKSTYTVTGDSAYDYTTEYSIERIQMQQKDAILLNIQDFEALADSGVKNTLLYSHLKTKTKRIEISQQNEKIVLDTLHFDMKADKLDLNALEALGKVDPDNEQEINTALQALVSKGMQLEIPKLSIANIEAIGDKMEGFHLDLFVEIDKSLNIASVQQNPMLALNAFTANINLSLSEALFAVIAQQPQAVMAMMLFHPKDVNGKKVYKFELKDGKFTVNDAPVM